MTDRHRPGTDPMEAALGELAAAIEWPATPPLATSVGAAIRAGATSAPRWRPARRALVLGVLAALLIAGLAAAVGIALGGLRILSSGDPPGSPLAPELVAERGLGERVTLAGAGTPFDPRAAPRPGSSVRATEGAFEIAAPPLAARAIRPSAAGATERDSA